MKKIKDEEKIVFDNLFTEKDIKIKNLEISIEELETKLIDMELLYNTLNLSKNNENNTSIKDITSPSINDCSILNAIHK